MRILVLLVVGLSSLGCGAATKVSEPSEINTFRFEFQSEPYEVISRRISGDGIQNFLLKRDDTAVVLRAVDSDRNGWIDRILLGDAALDVDRANEIYHAGIDEAMRRGLLRENVQDSTVQVTVTIKLLDDVRNGGVLRRGADVLRIAVLGSPHFDVSTIDSATIDLDGVERRSGSIELIDTNADQYVDAILIFTVAADTDVRRTSELCVTGATTDGRTFRGCEQTVGA